MKNNTTHGTSMLSNLTLCKSNPEKHLLWLKYFCSANFTLFICILIISLHFQ